MTQRAAAEFQRRRWLHRLYPIGLSIIAVAALAHVVHVVAQHTLEIVGAKHLLPRWDLATHLGNGWLDYHLLVTGQIGRLLSDLWLQGYWPPMLSIYQVPFYVVLGGDMTSGLWSSLVAFSLAGLTGFALIWRQWKNAGVLPASLFLALLMSSPFLLAYASVPMTEMLGALAQLLVLLAYVHYHHDPSPRAARLFAVSLTILFFTKYNYFLLLAAPLVLYERFEQTSGWNTGRRLTSLWRSTWRILSTTTGALAGLYLLGLLIIVRTGGFDFRLLGQRISVHTVGNSGYVIVYGLLARLWYLHRRGRIDWARLTSADARVRPLLLWFAAPVTVWLASPYPNHLKDFSNLVFNRPLGESTAEAGIAAYLDALRTYFYNEWLLACVLVVFAVAAVRYRQQPPLLKWLVLGVPLQFAVIAFHHTRSPRFLLLTVVLLCLAAASEVGQWFAGSRPVRVAATLLAPLVLASGVLAAQEVVTQARFRAIAFENYTENETLRAAFGSIRADLGAGDRLVVVGRGNELSPGLLRWELGPPTGVPCFPFEVGGARGIDLALATRVLLIVPLGPEAASLDVTNDYLAQRSDVLERLSRGQLVLRRELPVPEMRVAFRLYDRTPESDLKAPCQ